MATVNFGCSLRKFTAKILMKMADSDDETSSEHHLKFVLLGDGVLRKVKELI